MRMRQPCPDLIPRQLYVIVYPNDRWAFLHAENDYAGRQFSLSVVDGRWTCHVIYMSVLDVVQRQGVVVQLGLRGGHNRMLVEKSLKRTVIPQSHRENQNEKEDGCGTFMDHVQWFRNAVWKMIEDGVVECRDMRSLEIDIRMQSDEFWEERWSGMPFEYIPIADYIATAHISPALVFIIIAIFLVVFGGVCLLLCRHVFHFQRESYGRPSHCGKPSSEKPCSRFVRTCSEKHRIATTTRCPPPSYPGASGGVPESPALGFVSEEKFFARVPERSNSDLEMLLPSVAPRLSLTGLTHVHSSTHGGGESQPQHHHQNIVSTTILPRGSLSQSHQQLEDEKPRISHDENIRPRIQIQPITTASLASPETPTTYTPTSSSPSALLPPPVTQSNHANAKHPSKSRKSAFLNLFSNGAARSGEESETSATTTLIGSPRNSGSGEGMREVSPRTSEVRLSVTVSMPQSPSSAHCRSRDGSIDELGIGNGVGGSGHGRIATRTPLPLYATQSR